MTRPAPPRDEVHDQPLYARTLGLQHLTPSGFLCFAFLEGSIALGILLALAELVSWWGVLVLPATVAIMVKLNDVIAGAVSCPVVPAPRVVPSAAAGGSSRVPATGRKPVVAKARVEVPQSRVSNGSLAAARPALRRAAVPPVGSARVPVEDGSPGRAPTVDLRQPGARGWAAAPVVTAVESTMLNETPSSQWADDLDTHQQRARQSAARRYE